MSAGHIFFVFAWITDQKSPDSDALSVVFPVIKGEQPAYRADAGRTSHESALVGEEHHRDTP